VKFERREDVTEDDVAAVTQRHNTSEIKHGHSTIHSNAIIYTYIKSNFKGHDHWDACALHPSWSCCGSLKELGWTQPTKHGCGTEMQTAREESWRHDAESDHDHEKMTDQVLTRGLESAEYPQKECHRRRHRRRHREMLVPRSIRCEILR
jgi:hypothetical protein